MRGGRNRVNCAFWTSSGWANGQSVGVGNVWPVEHFHAIDPVFKPRRKSIPFGDQAFAAIWSTSTFGMYANMFAGVGLTHVRFVPHDWRILAGRWVAQVNTGNDHVPPLG